MLDNEQVRLIVNLDDLRDYDRAYADGWVLWRIELTKVCCYNRHLICPLSMRLCFN